MLVFVGIVVVVERLGRLQRWDLCFECMAMIEFSFTAYYSVSGVLTKCSHDRNVKTWMWKWWLLMYTLGQEHVV